MAWLALLPGRLLERTGNSAPRGMVAHDRTRLIGRLPTPVGAAKGVCRQGLTAQASASILVKNIPVLFS